MSRPTREELIRVCGRLSAALADEICMHYKPTGTIPNQKWNVEILNDAKQVLGKDFIVVNHATQEAIAYYEGR